MFFDIPIVKIFEPNVIFLPYFYRQKDPTLIDILNIKSVNRFYSLSWEQIFNQIQISNKLPELPPKNLIILAWSKVWKDKLVESISEKQVIIMGHPMWSIYWSNIPTPRTQAKFRDNSKLYIENLNWFNIPANTPNFTQFVTSERRVNLFRKFRHNLVNLIKSPFRELFIGIIDNPIEKKPQWHFHLTDKDISKLHNVEERLRSTIRLLNHNSFSIKVRPSATKRKEAFVEKLFKGTRVVRGKPLYSYLRKASMCFSDFSSSAIDAAILGVPTYGVAIDEIPEKLRFSWQAFFEPVNHASGRKLNYLFQLNREKILVYLLHQKFLNDSYFRDLFAILELNDSQFSPKIFQRVKSSFISLLLILAHFFQSSKLLRAILLHFSNTKLDLRTHTQDFISWHRFLVYKYYALFFESDSK